MSTGSLEVSEEMILAPLRAEEEEPSVSRRSVESIDGLSGIAWLRRPGRGEVVVHERDAQDFWNLRRWAVVPALLLYRYEANDDSCPAGVCDLERCEIEVCGPDVLRLWPEEGACVEARFRDTEARAAWREAAHTSSPRFVAIEANRTAAVAEAERERAAVAQAEAEAARAEVALQVEEAALARAAVAAVEIRVQRVQLSLGQDLENFADAVQADRASRDALLADTESRAKATAEILGRESAALRSRVATLEAQLAEAKADKAQRELVDREARKKAATERKLLVREIKDLRRCLARGASARDAADRVASFWDRDDDDDDDMPPWLVDDLLRHNPIEDRPPPQLRREGPVLAVRDLCSGTTAGFEPGTSADATHGLTPEQIAFFEQQRQRGEANAAASLGQHALRAPLLHASNALRGYFRALSEPGR